MKIKLIQVGQNKDNFVKEGVGKFKKLLSGYCDLEIITLKEARESKSYGPEKCQKQEAESIIKALDKLPPNFKIFLLDEKGKGCSSREFSRLISDSKDKGECLALIIGGAFGFPHYMKDKYPKISLSAMTFTHQMVRIFLLEQIYRGFCIMLGKEYHND